MKKLIIAVAIICAAVISQASTINWSAKKGYLYDGQGDSSGRIADETVVYLMFGNETSADNLVKGLTDATYASTVEAAKTAQGAVDGGRIDEASSSTLKGPDTTAYFVLFKGDNMYVSEITDATWNGVESQYDVAFSTSMTSSSKSLPNNSALGYTGAGWYTAAPEPTSGLLLLIGMAGLALRRRRA